MKKKPFTQSRVTLHVGRKGLWLIASHAGKHLSACVGTLASPRDCFQEAKRFLEQSELAKPFLKNGTPKINGRGWGGGWRLVVPVSYVQQGSFSEGSWEPELAMGVANEIERVCPVVLEELNVAAIPVSSKTTVSVGIPRPELNRWTDAAAEEGVLLEGVWSNVSALTEHLVEYPLGASEPSTLIWGDGHVRVEIASGGAGIESVRSRIGPVLEVTGDGEARCSAAATELFKGELLPMSLARETPIAHWPAIAAHELCGVHPFESLNFLRKSNQPLQSAASPMVRPLLVLSAGLILLGIGELISAHRLNNAAARANTQSQSVIRESHSIGPSATPLADLEQRIGAWRKLIGNGEVQHPNRRLLECLAAFIKQLPETLEISVSDLRLIAPLGKDADAQAGTMSVSGSAKTLDDARAIEEAMRQLSGVETEGFRTSSGGSGRVNFSLKIHFPETVISGLSRTGGPQQ